MNVPNGISHGKELYTGQYHISLSQEPISAMILAKPFSRER